MQAPWGPREPGDLLPCSVEGSDAPWWGAEWGRAGLNKCPLSPWMLGTRSQERLVHVVPLKAPPPVTLQ